MEHFKNINKLNSAMRDLIIAIRDNQKISSLINSDKSMRFALYECCKNEYLLNISYHQTANGDYSFQITDNVRIGEKGYLFLQNTSAKRRVFNFITKSIWGILLTVIGSVITAVIIYFLGIN